VNPLGPELVAANQMKCQYSNAFETTPIQSMVA
jgi:hypothetical protein